MARTIKTSNQNSSNQPAALPHHDQLVQSLVPLASDREQAKQPPIIEHKKAVVNISGLEEAVVIVTPGNGIIITDEMRAQLEKAKRVGESIPSDWDKPEAWTQDTDIEGNGHSHIRFRSICLSIVNLRQDKQYGTMNLLQRCITRAQSVSQPRMEVAALPSDMRIPI